MILSEVGCLCQLFLVNSAEEQTIPLVCLSRRQSQTNGIARQEDDRRRRRRFLGRRRPIKRRRPGRIRPVHLHGRARRRAGPEPSPRE